MLNEIIGQDTVKEQLAGVVATGRIAHAYQFFGPPSVGKFTCARAFAKQLICTSASAAGGPCNNCSDCRQVDKGGHPDLITITPDGSRIKIEQIRQLKKDVAFGPLAARWKFVIVKPADAMTNEAANSFLKLLEEPINGVVVILVTALPNAMLSTIRSRCQPVGFELLSSEEIFKIMTTKLQIPADSARTAADLSTGSIADALLSTESDMQSTITKLHEGRFTSFASCTSTASELLENKPLIPVVLNILLQKARTTIERSLILETLSMLRYNVNQLLTLETFLMKLGQVRTAQ